MVVIWVDNNPVDDGYLSMYMMFTHEIHVFNALTTYIQRKHHIYIQRICTCDFP